MVVPERTNNFLQTGLVIANAVVDTQQPYLLIMNLSEDVVEIAKLCHIAVGRAV